MPTGIDVFELTAAAMAGIDRLAEPPVGTILNLIIGSMVILPIISIIYDLSSSRGGD